MEIGEQLSAPPSPLLDLCFHPERSTGQDYAGNVKARAAGRVQAEVLCICLWFGVEERSQGQERG